MKHLIKIFFVLFLGMAAVPGQAELQLQRATLTVEDMDRSLAFYTDLLGFTVSGDARYDTPALRTMFHIPEGVTPRLVLLDASPAQPRALALVHAEGLSVDAESNARHAPALVINTTRLDEIMARATTAGVTVILPPTPLNDFSGKPFGREAMILDPDGVRIVFFELLKSDVDKTASHD
ncbi:MAG: VOC family protein [Xanthomonadales bacterium]|jgi:catechol 2,3-dioxygenase-like lactoylglutathione lyase family enzyme|nr:VOC family protein [Xanthomonadales bacterium]